MNKVYVGNLAWEVTDQELADFFKQAGEVVGAQVILNRDTGRSRGFAFVEMATKEGAERAMGLDGMDLNNRRVTVRAATPEREKEESGLVRSIKEFEANAKAGERLSFSVNNKHFTIVRDDKPEIDNSSSAGPPVVDDPVPGFDDPPRVG